MTYTLHRLAPGSYDLILNGEIVGSVVRAASIDGGAPIWHAELLDDPPSEKRPHPFSKIDHIFGRLQAVTAWLDNGEIIDRIRSPTPELPRL
ncbi:hypothetical protein ASF60_22965 [Methylobacterium sp. Leaf113]|uniref:hypothetical protein n=2 Tax=unclassified Methylobacterium TaxID=2615210 RepID=UPI0006F774B3|nr:hypothetical protein [Methylobacterium sp. Leaf113]KQP77426.1 hypothetical protein ASF60_22965 [Methylobacterium sp. Leaf113]MCK2057273.1 hypothetical protein [Methylobacterium sp. 37f]